MINILKLDGWDEDGKLTFSKEDSVLKELELFVSDLHTSVEKVNETLKESKYIIESSITGEENDYLMLVKIQYYGQKSGYEHKKNSHKQTINI
jgi:hypothetical protein